MIIIEKLIKNYGYFSVIDGASWQIPEKGVFGCVGENGAGKSTLLKILAGVEECDSGSVVVPKGCSIGYLPQEISALEPGPLLKVVESGRQDLIDREEELHTLSLELHNDSSMELVHKYAAKQEAFERDGGYSWRSRAREILVGIGFDASQFDAHISSFSGGWQMRAMLARLLLQNPSVLLLDEPTNHLDLETIQWLETFLSHYDGTVIVVSHDRFFLNRMVTGIVELERGKITEYNGNYDAYRKQKAEWRERQAAAASQQQREIDRVERFIERFRYKSKKARMVQSRIKMLDKLERIEGPASELDSIHFRFPQPPRMGRIVLETKGLCKAYGDNVLYDHLDLMIERGEKIALVGPNGAGKTTLLKMFAQRISPDSGEVEIGHNVEIAYFSQHAVDQLDPNKTVLNELWDVDVSKSQTEIRNLLGAFRFTGDDVSKLVSVLSGGEKSRLALAKLILKPGGLLLLDEPTNHLDIGSRQTLEFALNTFEGAFVVVSHDRYFVDEVATRIVHIENAKVTSYVGDYSYYVAKREEEATHREVVEQASIAQNKLERKLDGTNEALTKKELRQAMAEIRRRRDQEAKGLKKKLEKIEKEITELEKELAEIDKTFANPETYDDVKKVQSLTLRRASLDDSLLEKMEVWEELATTMSEIDEKYELEAKKLQC